MALVLDASGRVDEINEAGRDLIGRTSAEILGVTDPKSAIYEIADFISRSTEATSSSRRAAVRRSAL